MRMHLYIFYNKLPQVIFCFSFFLYVCKHVYGIPAYIHFDEGMHAHKDACM